MSYDLEIYTQKPFSKLTVAQRSEVLQEISKRLHYVALVARTLKDRRGTTMEKLGSKIDGERDTLAADSSERPAKVVYRALELMEDFDRDMMTGSRH
ncbi:hypothetical protein G6L68_25150 [Agrobacterium fabrum]|uniref:hypothetical protein n=1 Tax=Agrobacterium fabrum TaxID=1176649 RepID=UPI000EF5A7A2|nr:hypothetical protein [Agrobacterium fabrum]AYM66174.1 hypothetical protein At12D13_50220 [Agrobacterium fabrum]NTE63921.1 hypothetical protein [Agrobacterium fabrum]